jgi:hypothetical protein
MKISYRTHPALEYLFNGELDIHLYQSDIAHFNLRCKNNEVVKNIFYNHIKYFRNSIQYITDPVAECIRLSWEKLAKDDLINQISEETSGTFIAGNWVYCYSLGNINSTNILVFYKDVLVFLSRGTYNVSDQISYFSEHQFKNHLGDKYEYSKVVPFVFKQVFAALLFLKFAEVQTKELLPKSKIHDFNCKYVNNTKSSIQIIDSTWFTNLVKSDGFKVRGHFRLQPKKKDGEWTKELIWINDFQKEGYTRKAGILSNND